MPQRGMILFVCEHGASKSIVAATYFNKIAGGMGLGLRARAQGTNPDDRISPQAIAGLLNDGLAPIEAFPQKLLRTDLEAARRVISFCHKLHACRRELVSGTTETVSETMGCMTRAARKAMFFAAFRSACSA